MIPFFMKYKFVFLLMLLIEFVFAQDHFVSNSKNVPVFPLKKVQLYSLNDTLTMLDEEVYVYDKNKQPLKAISVSSKRDTSIREFVYNDQRKIARINYYNLVKHEKENEFAVEFSYNNNGLLSYEEFKNISGRDSYSFKYNSKDQLIEQKIYRQNDTRKITFEYDSLGQLKRRHDGVNTIEYAYWQGLLIKEMFLDAYNFSGFEILYSYENGLLTIIDRLNQIQKNTYLNRRLYKQKELVDRTKMISDCGIDTSPDPSTLKVFEYYD